MIRIIAGEYRSRMLHEPRTSEESRPYLSRIKESVFNLLRGWFEGARVLDLFAGVGTVGLEAVSRGAVHVVMVEQNRETFQHLVDNIDMLDCRDRAEPILGDALSEAVLHRALQPVDLVFIDPPYAMMQDAGVRQQVLDQIARCRSVMADSSFAILRSPIGPDEADLTITGFVGPEAHDYGRDKWVLLYQPRSQDQVVADETESTVPTPSRAIDVDSNQGP